ncbi:MAG TPA: T9SS type A sorting domain-containing protein, partial [Dysgonamonadaceae bacterium]|nr:T9SS type A sorting domain-containing protein [Dysgonamonadaceae bacterium]
NLDAAPQDVYNFAGTLFVGDATVALTKTENVNYSGTNLVSNSYTAAIPISADAMTFPAGVEETVYLFNTGTRDQWRKLNGTNISGYKSGQYLSVPLNLGGTSNFPDRIPSTHAFMVLKSTAGDDNLIIDYSKLVKNSIVNKGDGTQITTRAMGSSNESKTSSVQQLPSLVIDVIGEESADRVWIFQKEGTSHNFNNGWDGRKMLEDDIAQLYVSALDDSKLQVATVPQLDSLSLGFIADIDGKYTFEFAQMGQLKGTDIYLHDAVTGITQQVGDEQSYSFTAKRGEAANRFSLSSKENSAFLSTDEALLEVAVTNDGEILIVNSSSRTVSAFVYDSNGVFLQQLEVNANDKTIIDSVEKGTYIVRLQNSHVNDVRRVTVE